MLIGAGVVGAVSGYLFTYAVVVILVVTGSAGGRRWSVEDTSSEAPRLRLEATAMATFVVAVAPFSLDQILVQVFAPSLGGNYAAVATIAKAVFFAAHRSSR